MRTLAPKIYLTLSLWSLSVAAAPQDVTYSYDSLGRLASATYAQGVQITYSYDANGNRTQRIIQAATDSLLGFAAAAAGYSESAGTVNIAVQRTGALSGAVSVDYQAVNGTAINGVDFIVIDGVLNWPDGDGSDRFIAVQIIDDDLPEGPESWQLQLSNPQGTAQLGSPNLAVISLLDNDDVIFLNGFEAP